MRSCISKRGHVHPLVDPSVYLSICLSICGPYIHQSLGPSIPWFIIHPSIRHTLVKILRLWSIGIFGILVTLKRNCCTLSYFWVIVICFTSISGCFRIYRQCKSVPVCLNSFFSRFFFLGQLESTTAGWNKGRVVWEPTPYWTLPEFGLSVQILWKIAFIC